MTLIELAKKNSIDYEAISRRCTFKGQPQRQFVDISVIIPVRGRTQFHKIVVEHFQNAMEDAGRKVAITFVEHADGPPMHYWLSKSSVNHIFIPADGKPFNKCLCHNMGVLYGPKANCYLFHDTDIIVPPDFFNKLGANMAAGYYDAMQAFTQRRVLMANEAITNDIINHSRPADFGNYSPHEIRPAIPGAPGGSIFVTWERLLEVGLYEDVFFTGYSVEDQFFFNKLKLIGKLGFCDNPPIEVIHLWHSTEHQETTNQSDFVALDMFDVMDEQGKREYINSRYQHFLKYFK